LEASGFGIHPQPFNPAVPGEYADSVRFPAATAIGLGRQYPAWVTAARLGYGILE
jgi:hypothetical protein